MMRDKHQSQAPHILRITTSNATQCTVPDTNAGHHTVTASPHLTQLKTEMWMKHQCLKPHSPFNTVPNTNAGHHIVHASPYLTQLKTERWMKHHCLIPHSPSFTVPNTNAEHHTVTASPQSHTTQNREVDETSMPDTTQSIQHCTKQKCRAPHSPRITISDATQNRDVDETSMPDTAQFILHCTRRQCICTYPNTSVWTNSPKLTLFPMHCKCRAPNVHASCRYPRKCE